MSKNKVTLREAGLEYIRFDAYNGGHILQDVETKRFELWFANKNHANYGIKFKNTHLEFAREVK